MTDIKDFTDYQYEDNCLIMKIIMMQNLEILFTKVNLLLNL